MPIALISRRGRAPSGSASPSRAPGSMAKSKAPATLSLSRSAQRRRTGSPGCGSLIQKAVKIGNSSAPGRRCRWRGRGRRGRRGCRGRRRGSSSRPGRPQAVADAGAVDRVAQAEAGEAHVGGEAGGRAAVREREEVGVEGEVVDREGDGLRDAVATRLISMRSWNRAGRHEVQRKPRSASAKRRLSSRKRMARNWSYFRSAKGSVIFISGRRSGEAAAGAGAGDDAVKAESAGGGLGVGRGGEGGEAGAEEASEGGVEEAAAVHRSSLAAGGFGLERNIRCRRRALKGAPGGWRRCDAKSGGSARGRGGRREGGIRWRRKG